MGYADAQKLHDLRMLQPGARAAPHSEALRIVLAVAVDRVTAAWCLGCPAEPSISRWPSTVYGVLADAAAGSPEVWRRCALVLDRSLDEVTRTYRHRSAAELAEAFSEGRESLTGEELAGLLWCLIRRRCGSHNLVAGRLTQELEVIAANRLHVVPP